MTRRFEVYIREDLVDAAGDGLLKDIEDLGIKGAKDARFIRVTELEGKLTPAEAMYQDCTVRVRGKVTEYQGKPQIVLTGPQQVDIIE